VTIEQNSDIKFLTRFLIHARPHLDHLWHPRAVEIQITTALILSSRCHDSAMDASMTHVLVSSPMYENHQHTMPTKMNRAS